MAGKQGHKAFLKANHGLPCYAVELLLRYNKPTPKHQQIRPDTESATKAAKDPAKNVQSTTSSHDSNTHFLTYKHKKFRLHPEKVASAENQKTSVLKTSDRNSAVHTSKQRRKKSDSGHHRRKTSHKAECVPKNKIKKTEEGMEARLYNDLKSFNWLEKKIKEGSSNE